MFGEGFFCFVHDEISLLDFNAAEINDSKNIFQSSKCNCNSFLFSWKPSRLKLKTAFILEEDTLALKVSVLFKNRIYITIHRGGNWPSLSGFFPA